MYVSIYNKYLLNICVSGIDTSVNKTDKYQSLHGVDILVGETKR